MRKLITLTTLALVAVLVATPAAAQQCTAEANAIFEAMATVAALDVPIENALLTELAAAMVGVASGDTEAAIADLEAFINKVAAQSGKQLDAATAAELIAFAQSVINGTLCPCTDLWTNFLAFATDQPGFVPVAIPYQVIGIFGPFYEGGFGVQEDFFGTGSPTGFVCGHDAYPAVPELTVLPLDQIQLDACSAVVEGYFTDFGCPFPPEFPFPCGGAGPVGAAPSQFGSTPFTGGGR